MSELFWFLLGVVSYRILFTVINYGHRLIFLNKIKHLAFLLIGRAYQELLLVEALKYKTILEATSDKEKIKLHKNSDEMFLEEWKKKVVTSLNSSVPAPYKNAIGLDDWQHLIQVMDNYYKTRMRGPTDEKQKD